MDVKIQLFEVGAYRSDFCLWGWMKSEVYKEKVYTRDELVASIMNSVALTKQERQDYLRRATRSITKRVDKCIEVEGGIFEHLLRTIAIYRLIYISNKLNQYVTYLSFIRFVRLFMRNIQTVLSPHPLKIGHIFI